MLKHLFRVLSITTILFASIGWGQLASAQSRAIFGKVVDANGEPIIGAAVVVPGTTTGATTDLDGNFNLRVAPGAALEVSCIGYVTRRVNASDNIKLTPRMNIQASSGFDIMAMKVTTTQISATYDLHCFNIAVTWVPLGQWKSYSFRIAANASALADLLRFKKSSSYMDNMLGGNGR